MNQYADIKVLECSRLHSEQAKVNNNENLALWQNNLQDIVHLDAGDKVSVFGAMVSERGAGQPTSIEIKGQKLGFSKVFNHSTFLTTNACDSIPSKYEIIECQDTATTVDIRDDTLVFNVSYYMNATAQNYIHLPRRWWYEEQSSVNIKPDEQWTLADDLDAGMSYFNPFKDTFWFYDDYYQIIPTAADHTAGTKFFKTKNNNERYTILMRDKSYFTEESASGKFAAEHMRDPENGIYHTYKELKQINVPAGFNSPEYVAQELTRQLQDIKEVERYEFRAANDLTTNASSPGYPIRMYDTIETETYKPFNVAYAYWGKSNGETIEVDDYSGVKKDFGFYYNGSNACATTNASGFKYLSQYHVVATKRPELYETGRLCNFFREGTYTGISGAAMPDTWGSSNEIKLDQTYNQTNCKVWKDFFDAQDLYPEIWNTFSDSRTQYSASDTINNSRWMHMNRYNNASMSDGRDPFGPTMLGDSGYTLHSWNASNLLQAASSICPLYYDPSQKDTFYDNPSEEQYSYGCIRKSADGKIILYGTANNGFGSNYHNMLKQGGVVNLRKCGFDMHFSAPGMCYLLPYAGWSPEPNSYDVLVRTHATGNYDLFTGYAAGATAYGEHRLDSQLYRNKLYIGADNPEILYDGTNFNLSGLHTPINKGNNNLANNDYSGSMVQIGNGQEDPEAPDQVYVINPREQWNDWTPARKPYRINVDVVKTTRSPAMNLPRFNDNLQAWTIYDALCGIFISDINLTENEWDGTLWDILGFSYKQFNSTNNTRITRIDNNNINDLSLITTNAEVAQGDSKIYIQNLWGAPLYNNMIGGGGGIYYEGSDFLNYYPEIKQKTQSVKIVADNLPTRMIRGYYTIRSNILEEAPFVGGKVNNTTMPIIGIVNKINAAGDFYTQQESTLDFTITKPLRLASITCSIHDPDGSYAKCSEQSTVLFKIQKTKSTTFNVVQEIIQEQQQGSSARAARI